ncbi:MAG TPA: NAD(P)H-dependent oxidoreductase, partial [Usitatibacteraceae bacterium]|nr:NAD(P)H-dependent oxidoreductase [Usitatibacteraceae bacterium]
TIVIGLPMYNFGIPSTLKAYFDHVARAGVTFKYTEKGPVGLLGGKRAVILAARGGLYAGTPMDTQSAYVRDFLRFVGIDDVRFVYAEGLAMGEGPRAEALAKAGDEIARLATAPASNDALAAAA